MHSKRLPTPINMCEGPVLSQMVRFAIPLMLTGILQLLYNAADMIVVGQFTGSIALAAVGGTASLINLIVNMCIGLSIGANVTIARTIGAKDAPRAASATHTAITVSVIGGVLLMVVGLTLSTPLLALMGTPQEVLPHSALYMRIIAIGFPANMVYNFGAAVLRANGDTRRPLYLLLLSGSVNVILNLIFIIVFHMGVAGVALATIISQYVSAVLVVRALEQLDGPCRLNIRALKINKDDFFTIVKVGVPAGLQATCFSLSNVLIQSSINSFGADAMAGNTAASSIEGFIYTAMDAVAQASLTFTGQNIGAKQYRRIPRIIRCALLLIFMFSTLLGLVAIGLHAPLLSIYIKENATAVAIGAERLLFICPTYFLLGWMNAYANALRAMGYSLLPMVSAVVGVCALRIVFIYTVFRWVHTLEMLYASYPISWLITAIAVCIFFHILHRRLLRKQETA